MSFIANCRRAVAMDFGALPPEVNSGRMYLGPGPATLLAASAGWDSIAVELRAVAGGYQSVLSGLTEEWLGPTSMSVATAVVPYVSWLTATAEQCARAATQVSAAADAFETAYAMTVPPPLIAANRVRLLTLVADNSLGQRTPAIMAAEAEYSEMWAQDTTAMYDYAASSASASTLTTFVSPPHATRTQAGSAAQKTSAQMMSSMSQALQDLSTPGSSSGAEDADPAFDAFGADPDEAGLGADDAALGEGPTVHVGAADALGGLAVPPSWADAVSSLPPPPTLDANVMPGGWGALPSPGPAISTVQRIGIRSSLIRRSAVAG